jgi:hypothetical protein
MEKEKEKLHECFYGYLGAFCHLSLSVFLFLFYFPFFIPLFVGIFLYVNPHVWVNHSF